MDDVMDEGTPWHFPAVCRRWLHSVVNWTLAVHSWNSEARGKWDNGKMGFQRKRPPSVPELSRAFSHVTHLFWKHVRNCSLQWRLLQSFNLHRSVVCTDRHKVVPFVLWTKHCSLRTPEHWDTSSRWSASLQAQCKLSKGGWNLWLVWKGCNVGSSPLDVFNATKKRATSGWKSSGGRTDKGSRQQCYKQVRANNLISYSFYLLYLFSWQTHKRDTFTFVLLSFLCVCCACCVFLCN